MLLLKTDNDIPIHNRRWTRSAVECYSIGCICCKCPIFNIIGDRCRMKKTVIALVRIYGRPKREICYEKK